MDVLSEATSGAGNCMARCHSSVIKPIVNNRMISPFGAASLRWHFRPEPGLLKYWKPCAYQQGDFANSRLLLNACSHREGLRLLLGCGFDMPDGSSLRKYY